MNQSERRMVLLQELLGEREAGREEKTAIPRNKEEQKLLLRGLMNIRPSRRISPELLKIQDEYLREETKEKGIVELEELEQIQTGIYVWQGDITTLHCDAIVNAANL